MNLIFRALDISEEYREIEFNFQIYSANFVFVVVLKRGISSSLQVIQLISEPANQRARKAQFTCPLSTNFVCLFIIFSLILTNRSSQFSLILQHTMIVSAEIQVRALCNGALVLFFRFQVTQAENGDTKKKRDFQGELGNLSTEHYKKYALYFKTSKLLRT